MGRAALLASVIAAAVALAGGYALGRELRVEPPRRADAARLMNELMAGNVPVGGPFTLADTEGKRVSLSDFRGKVVVLYFGYTFCPDVCPTDLSTIAAAVEKTDVQPVFVTLDPARDTPSQLATYIRSFGPRFIALRGSERETREVATAWKVFYEKVRQQNSPHYVIDHSAFTFVIDRDGNYAGFFPPGTGTERMAAAVRDVAAR